MTVSEAARQLGISKQALYQKINRRGDLKRRMTFNGQIVISEAILEELRNIAPSDKTTGYDSELSSREKDNDALVAQVKALSDQVEQLTKVNDGQAMEINRLNAVLDNALTEAKLRAEQVEDLRKDKASLMEALQREQIINVNTIQRLLPAPHRSLWDRITGRGKGVDTAQ